MNISPETFVDIAYHNDVEDFIYKRLDLSKEEYSIGANGARYRKDVRGVLPTVVEKVFFDRKNFKKKMIEAKKDKSDLEAEMKRRGLL